MTVWLGVASAEHVARGASLGIAQIGHGRRAGLDRMRRGDTLVYYSPTTRLGVADRLQSFTALAEIDGDEIWQADEGDFHPFRRSARYETTRPVRAADLQGALDLTAEPSWGYQLRRGLLVLSARDGEALASAMIVA